MFDFTRGWPELWNIKEKLLTLNPSEIKISKFDWVIVMFLYLHKCKFQPKNTYNA